MSSQHPSEVSNSTSQVHPTSPPRDIIPATTENTPVQPTPSETPSAMELAHLPASTRLGEDMPHAGVTPSIDAGPTAPITTSTIQPSEAVHHPAIERTETEAIGPATEGTSAQSVPGSTALQITLLLSSGSRHPFRIDEKYLRKRGVDVEDMSPMNISVYTMKELIWKDWRAEWEPRPSSPAYIRLIYFGAMLDDKNALKDCRLNAVGPNVVHMSVKPQEIVEEEDVKQTSKKGARRGSETERQGSRCCVIL